MQALKNILFGILVSFIGSIPLGYLNIIGFQIYHTSGKKDTVLYLLGVIFVEYFVIYFTLLFANKLMQNDRLIRVIKAFSILFMFFLAYLFYSSSNSQSINTSLFNNYSNYPFLFGLLLSCMNLVQIPFWTSWNLYLLNGNYITISKKLKYFYLLGTVIGTFFGMLFLIIFLSYITNQTSFLSKYLIKTLIPLVFIGLGVYQAICFFFKSKKV